MSFSISLRDYQKEALETVLSEYNAGVNRQLISLPTGSGKTIIMSAIAKQFNKKTLILAHREELIQQTVDKLKLFWPGVDVGICMAERNEIHQQIVIGSVQSCSRQKRLERLVEQNFDVLMIDEAHHATADSYQNIINSLGFHKDARKLLIGVTATPSRGDKQALGATFDKIIFNRSIGTMIKAGYLSPVIGRKIHTNFILEKIRTQNGDFSISDLAEAVNTTERNKFIVDKFKAHSQGRKAISFCVDVQHCKDLAEAFNKQGIPSAAIWGEMESAERKQAIENLKNGKIQIATSCGVLTEGFDEPTIDAIVMARPTKSPGLYIQCVGRGLRLWPGKQNCLVLDFTDRSHNLDSIMSLKCTIPEANNFKDDLTATEREEVDKSPKIECLEECDKEFDILGSSRFMWIPIGDGEWSLIDDEKREIVMRPISGGYIAVIYQPNGIQSQIVNTPLPIEYCSGVCEDYARRNLKISFADLTSPWMTYKAVPTQGQFDYLKKQGAYRDGMSKAEAALEIRKIISLKNKNRRNMSIEPITNKQKFALRRHGIDTSNMSKLQAMEAISKIKSSENMTKNVI